MYSWDFVKEVPYMLIRVNAKTELEATQKAFYLSGGYSDLKLKAIVEPFYPEKQIRLILSEMMKELKSIEEEKCTKLE